MSSRASNPTKSTKNPISKALKGVGIEWVREVDRTYDVGKMRETIREALTTPHKGPKVIVASSECMLNRQRRERPLCAKRRSRKAGGSKLRASASTRKCAPATTPACGYPAVRHCR